MSNTCRRMKPLDNGGQGKKERVYRHRIYNSYNEKAIYVYTTKATALTKDELYSFDSYANGLIKAVALILISPAGAWYANPHFDMMSEFVTYYASEIPTINVQFQFWMDFQTQQIVEV